MLASPVLDCDNYVFKLKSNRLSTMPAFYADLLLNAKYGGDEMACAYCPHLI